MTNFNKEDLIITTRVVLTFSIIDKNTKEIVISAQNEAMINEIYEFITGQKYRDKMVMELQVARN